MALVPVAVLGEKADRQKPTHIEADSLRHDELNQVSIFAGHAMLRRGTMVLRGARIEMREDAEGYQFGTITAQPGERAFFRQKREGLDEFVEGEAVRIEFDGKADHIQLIDNAEVRRYRGAVLADQMTGKRIVYENLTDVFSINGQRTETAGKTTHSRVRAVLAPRSKPGDKP